MTTSSELKVGFLISYDYEYLKNSLPQVYDHVDYIALAIDKKRLTWSGNSFHIPDEFFDWIAEYDLAKKIHIYEDDFCVPELNQMECETRERSMLSHFMGQGGWHVQIDTDEYFLNFKEFKEYVGKYVDYDTETVIKVPFYTIYKQDDRGYYLVTDSDEYYPVATNNPQFIRARFTKCENFTVIPTPILHQSWGKNRDQIRKKIDNWGHKNDFDTEAYFKLWDFVDPFTYRYIKDFHPIVGEVWRSLEYIKATEVSEMIELVRNLESQKKSQINNTAQLGLREFVPPIFYRLQRVIKRKLK